MDDDKQCVIDAIRAYMMREMDWIRNYDDAVAVDGHIVLPDLADAILAALGRS